MPATRHRRDPIRNVSRTSRSRRLLEKSLATRRQLIEATIVAIAAGGLQEATLTIVSDLSGLSRSLVGYHFKSKNQMLKETLLYLTHEYREGWQAALCDPDASPEGRLLQLIDFDLGTRVCSVDRVAVWYAFWGSVVTKQLYRDVSLPVDRSYMTLIAKQVKALADEDRIRGLNASNIAKGYAALIIGLWQQFNISPGDFDRANAKAICRAHFHGFFPGRFEHRPMMRSSRSRRASDRSAGKSSARARAHAD
jgi:TetR/AcrR family transcriptional regulator, transcriptional repressor of bet genes